MNVLSNFQRAQTEAVTFLGNQDNGRTLYAVPGLDYIAHEDVMPYIAGDKRPIRHDLFDKFLVHTPEKGILRSLCITVEPISHNVDGNF